LPKSPISLEMSTCWYSRRRARAMQNIFTKEPYFTLKEPYIIAKGPYITANVYLLIFAAPRESIAEYKIIGTPLPLGFVNSAQKRWGRKKRGKTETRKVRVFFLMSDRHSGQHVQTRVQMSRRTVRMQMSRRTLRILCPCDRDVLDSSWHSGIFMSRWEWKCLGELNRFCFRVWWPLPQRARCIFLRQMTFWIPHDILKSSCRECKYLSELCGFYFRVLQHTATHCNTLQHTSTHCNTLQHTATHLHV